MDILTTLKPLPWLVFQLAVFSHALELSQPLSFVPASSLSLPQAYRSTLARHQHHTSTHPTEQLQNYTWDSQYLVEIQVGTPPQLLNLILDTGSSDLWVFSPEVPVFEQQGHNEYDPSLSSTAKLLPNATWAVHYGDGSTSNGNVVIDVVTLAGIASPSQAVETAQNASIDFYESPRADGIIGFGFSDKNKVKPVAQKTWFDNIKSTLRHAFFTLDLRHNDYSSIDFGFLNRTKYTGDISYLPIDVAPEGAWAFNATGFKIGHQPPMDLHVNAIADSGTSLMVIDDLVLTAFYSKIQNSTFDTTEHLWVFPCNSTIPEFTVCLGDFDVAIPPSYLVFGQTDFDPSVCYGSLQSNAGLGLSIYGITFLKSLFVVYDEENMRVGFAKKHLVL